MINLHLFAPLLFPIIYILIHSLIPRRNNGRTHGIAGDVDGGTGHVEDSVDTHDEGDSLDWKTDGIEDHRQGDETDHSVHRRFRWMLK